MQSMKISVWMRVKEPMTGKENDDPVADIWPLLRSQHDTLQGNKWRRHVECQPRREPDDEEEARARLHGPSQPEAQTARAEVVEDASQLEAIATRAYAAHQ